MSRKVQVRRIRRGFTLIEILIVIGILVLLAALVVPNLMNQSEEAKIGIAQSQVGRSGSVGAALNKYKLDIGRYPDSDEGLAALYEIPSSVDEESGKWKGPYMEGNPADLRDPWGNEFTYEYPGKFNENGYDLSSPGPDGEEGTDDDVKNWTES